MSKLARRFIIICLIFVIFALLMAAAVNAGHGQSSLHNGVVDLCVFHPDLNCMVSH